MYIKMLRALNVPKTLVKDMKIEIKNADDKWQEIDGIKGKSSTSRKNQYRKNHKSNSFYFNFNQRAKPKSQIFIQ